MTHLSRYLLGLLLILSGASFAQAGETKARSSDGKGDRHALFISKDNDGKVITKELNFDESIFDHGEKKVVTFLGVQTDQVSATLRTQLGLPDGTGLVVVGVVPDSSAVEVLKTHDILVKFDDQILVSSHQLAVLVRNHAKGDQIVLTFRRGGKESTATVTLGEKEMRVKQKYGFNTKGGESLFEWRDLADELAGLEGKEADKILRLMELDQGAQERRVITTEQHGDHVVKIEIQADNSTMDFEDEAGSLELITRDGQKTLIAKNAQGEVVFSGPISTPEEREKLSPELLKRLDKIEQMPHFKFHTDEDFEGIEKRVIRPRTQGAAVRSSSLKNGLRRIDTY